MSRKYGIGYKPRICLINCVIKYYENKYHNSLMNKSSFNRYKNKIKEIKIKEALAVLDEENKFPTKNIEKRFLTVNLTKNKVKISMDNFKIGVRDIDIISEHGRVSYEFNENIH